MVNHPIVDAYLRSDLFGRLIFLSLLILSIVAGVILIYKIWLARAVNRLSDQIEKAFMQKKKTPLNIDFRNLMQSIGVPNPFFDLYKMVKLNTVEILKKNRSFSKPVEGDMKPTYLSSTDIEQVSAQVDAAIHTERKRLERYLFILPTIVSLAPLLGLLGTVWGISVTFSQMPNKSNALSNDAVLSGLAMALGTTVIGIIVAIPALIAYNYIKHLMEEYSTRMDEFSSEILSSIEMLYRAVDVKHHE